jgi:hypothetical protein
MDGGGNRQGPLSPGALPSNRLGDSLRVAAGAADCPLLLPAGKGRGRNPVAATRARISFHLVCEGWHLRLTGVSVESALTAVD